MVDRFLRSFHRTPVAIPARWSCHHRHLLQLRSRLLRADLGLLENARTPAEAGLGAQVIDFTLALLTREYDALGEVDAALDRIEHGTYGTCEATGRPIPPDRLRAVPWLRHACEVAPPCEGKSVPLG